MLEYHMIFNGNVCLWKFVCCLFGGKREKKIEQNFFICFQVLFQIIFRLFLVMLSVLFILVFITFTINIIFLESSVRFFILWNTERSVFQGKWTRNTKDGWGNKTKNIICLRNLFFTTNNRPFCNILSYSELKMTGINWAPDLHFVQQEKNIFLFEFRMFEMEESWLNIELWQQCTSNICSAATEPLMVFRFPLCKEYTVACMCSDRATASIVFVFECFLFFVGRLKF